MGDYANGGTLKVKATASGGTKTVSLTSDMTVNQFVAALKDAGLSANFDSGNQRIFINSKTSGLDGEFTLEGADGNGTGALKALGLLTSSEAKNNYSTVAGWTDADVVANAKSAYNSKIASYNKTIQSYLAGNSSLKNANETTLAYRKEYAEIYAAKLSYEDTYDADGKLVSQTATAASRAEAFKAVNEKIDALKNSDRKKELAAAEKVAGDLGNDTLLVTRTRKETVNDDGSTTAVMEDNDIDKYIKGISSAIKTNEETIASNMEAIYNLHKEVDSSFDKTSFDADSATEDNALITVDFAEGDTLDAATAANSANKLASDLIASYKAQREEAKTKLAQYEEAQKKADAGQASAADNELLGIGSSSGSATVRITGQDAIIELNGATFTSNTNNFSVNGLTIQALSVNSASDPVTITTDTDVDGIYNMIKDFFKEYNEIVNYMDEKYNASSAKGYEPLTDDEKDAMTDTEIEKWETKIKDSLLRKDNTLSTISNSMKTNMLKSYEINGTKYNLSSFGIATLSYFTAGDNEHGAFHIDGNADDSQTSGNTDKLRAAIASDPDTVVEFFSKLTTEVYNDLTKRMSRTNLSSAYTLYNDKQMNTEYSNYSTKISEWETKISEKEDYYYKKFSSMESALSKLNSQQSSLSNYFS